MLAKFGLNLTNPLGGFKWLIPIKVHKKLKMFPNVFLCRKTTHRPNNYDLILILLLPVSEIAHTHTVQTFFSL